MTGVGKRVEALFNKRRVEESPFFLSNGGALMEKLISLSNGRDEIHIKRFSIQEITKATNNFEELVRTCDNCRSFKGNLEGCPVLVVIWETAWLDHDSIVFGMAISALMSHLKYVLKLLGCCLDFEIPALVYEYAGDSTLRDFLGEDPDITLSWISRIKIARDIAGMVVYLHTCFPMAIIHRDLNPLNVFIDQNGDAKLFDFSTAIQIPEGETAVEDLVTARVGFLDPEYFRTSLVTTKTDVYSFGVMLLMLVTGNRLPFLLYGERMHLCEYVEKFMDVDDKLIDHNISEEVGIDEFQAIKYLALSCTESIPDYRPEMIDVARKLHEIEKQVKKSSCRIVSPVEDNEDAVLKKLMVLSNGRFDDIPFHIFSSEEIINGTNNFRDYFAGDSYYGIFKGYLNRSPVLVKKWEVLQVSSLVFLRHAAVVEAAICSLTSDFKHVPKLLGCCLEIEIPFLVFEDFGSATTLNDILYTTDDSRLLSWVDRLKIASNIATIVSHLHTAFSTPIIHRDLKPSNVIISKNGEAKLVEFSLAVALPPGISKVKDNFIFGTWGSLDPDYITSKFVSTKTDVYSFGVLLLALLTGMSTFWVNSEGMLISIMSFIEQVISDDQIESLVDPRILQGVEMAEFEALLDIARRCTRIRGEDRPEMIEVARLLHQIDNVATRVTSYNEATCVDDIE